ncbi:TPA: nickel pincer cofactor biosynthesis protein LarB [Candidatus Bathyarchaeota archaeon]|nr:nickel pincer cofactor biosynthesis protein LarB [Candidatus Bathyarchaeota archaeon]
MREILEGVKAGRLSLEEAEKLLKLLTIQEVGEAAKLDVGRELRRGVPEIIYAESKPKEHLIRIVSEASKERDRVIVSRLEPKLAKAIKEALGDVAVRYDEEARVMVVRKGRGVGEGGGRKVGLITAGTADIPVALEAKVAAEELGCEVLTAFDVGVAGIHRLFDPLKRMIEESVDAIIVVAGMEGALPSVVASLVDVPVIGVPTSVGYGLGKDGIGALTAMLQSCSLGLAVVNIDGGVAAGVFAALIANRAAKASLK